MILRDRAAGFASGQHRAEGGLVVGRSARRPNVFVIGAPKCGTTSLYEYLGQHPDVFVSSKKELHYYSFDLLQSRSRGPGDDLALAHLIDNENDYLSYFAKSARFSRIVEVSPSYMFNHEVSSRIHADSPQAYVIAIIRNPVDRAYSQWLHQRRSLFEPLRFADAIAAEGDRIRAGWSDAWRYVDSSRYAPGIKAYLEVFGADRVHVTTAEELLDQPAATMRAIFEFLQIDPAIRLKEAHRNQGGEVRSRAIARLLVQPNRASRAAGRMLTQSFRTKLALRLTELNTMPTEPLHPRARASLFPEFRDDTLELEDLLERRMPWGSPCDA